MGREGEGRAARTGVHVLVLYAAEKLPAAQGSQVAEPSTGAAYPGGHGVQERLARVPLAGAGVEPRGHFRHAAEERYTDPSGHPTHAVKPGAATEPNAHIVHDALEEEPVACDAVPSGHCGGGAESARSVRGSG